MNTFKLKTIIDRTDAGTRLQVIEYRGVLVTRQWDADCYIVTVEFLAEEIEFNHLIDALKWVEDELNREDQRHYYRTQADLHREWAARVI